MALTPAERKLRASIAAHTLHAQGKTNTAPARKAFMERFERQVDPNGSLDDDERARRAHHAMKAYMKALAFKRHRNGGAA